MSCHICDNLEVLHAQNIEDLFEELMCMMCDEEIEEVCLVADEENTKELLYYAINGEYGIGSIELNSYEYDGPYITTIEWDDDNYAITVERAYEYGHYCASAAKTYVQYDLPEKCDYINGVIRNKYFDPDLAIFEVGEVIGEDDESDDGERMYTYANEYSKDGVFGQIFVSSNLKDYVESVKEDFEDIFFD